ncbi:unnamed protein product [Paramecium primaurelia]|uniref:Uncharacterized protein n=1 Tax=Paramecium primaurelia TaxID=5886 RepID=A0A8S1Q4E8_PARPR|nr:unnamed protein product [Paramecium primaurelia]
MDQQSPDIKELLLLYNNAIQIKKRAEKKLIRFTNCLSELDRRNCGVEIIEQINVVRQQIKEERKNQAEQTVRNSYVLMQNQMDKSSLILQQKLQEKQLQLESMELEYKCQIQQQQQIINHLNLQIEEVKDYNQEQIFCLTQKNQQLLYLIEDLNNQIAELKQILEHYQNEEFKYQNNNNSSIRVSQNSQMLQNIKKLGSQDYNHTIESMDQCQFETLASEVKYQETCQNFDEEILLGSYNQCSESKDLQSPIKIQDQKINPNQINELTFTIEELKEQLQNLQFEKQRLIDNMKENQENYDAIIINTQLNQNNLNNQINDLIQLNQELFTKEQILQTQVQEQINQIEILTEQLVSSKQLLNKNDETISILQQEQEITKSQILLFKEQLEIIPKLEQEIKHHQLIIQDYENQILSSTIKRSELDDKLNQQHINQEKFKTCKQDLTKSIQDLNSQLTESQIKYQVLEQENFKQQQQIILLNEQKNEQQLQYEDLKQKYYQIQQNQIELEFYKEKEEDALNFLNKQFECNYNNNEFLENKIQNYNLQSEINQLKIDKEELIKQNNSKDLLIQLQQQLENQYKVLEEQLKNAKQQQQDQCNKITEYYKQEIKLMQEQLIRNSENIKQYSPVNEISQDDKYKEYINRLNDELRQSKLQIAQSSVINNQLKQQQKDLVLKLQSMLKLTPTIDQDLNDLILIIESNLSSCQSSPVRQSFKRTSMIDTTKMLMNKSRFSFGSNRGSVQVSQKQLSDNGYRNSLNILKVPQSSQCNTDLQKILDDVSDQDIIQQ